VVDLARRTRAGNERATAFAELCRFVAAHEAAEEECIHAPAKEEIDGDTSVVDQRIEQEDKAGRAITELEALDTDSQELKDSFESFRRAVIAHAEAEEHQELPRLYGVRDRLLMARAELRSGVPTAR